MKDVSEGKSKGEAEMPDFSKGTVNPDAFDPGMMKRMAAEEKKEYTYIATHTVESGDTLSGLAKKYYGSEAQQYWMEIYEANKGVIGDNPNLILVGQVLNIPEKPKA